MCLVDITCYFVKGVFSHTCKSNTCYSSRLPDQGLGIKPVRRHPPKTAIHKITNYTNLQLCKNTQCTWALFPELFSFPVNVPGDFQWRRQAWGTGARAPWSLRMHANFAAVQTMAMLIFLPSSVNSKLDCQSHQNPEINLYLVLP